MKRNLAGFCVGGPWAGRTMASIDKDYPVALMKHNGDHEAAVDMQWDEVRRGAYEFDAGVWWWRGWEKPGEQKPD